jgi:hypothetical protein
MVRMLRNEPDFSERANKNAKVSNIDHKKTVPLGNFDQTPRPPGSLFQ